MTYWNFGVLIKCSRNFEGTDIPFSTSLRQYKFKNDDGIFKLFECGQCLFITQNMNDNQYTEEIKDFLDFLRKGMKDDELTIVKQELLNSKFYIKVDTNCINKLVGHGFSQVNNGVFKNNDGVIVNVKKNGYMIVCGKFDSIKSGYEFTKNLKDLISTEQV